MGPGIGTLSNRDRQLLQLVYDLMSQGGTWPTFTAVDLKADRELGVENTQEALARIPDQYIYRAWQSHGYYGGDEVRLTLRGIAECPSGSADIDLLIKFIKWLVDVELKADIRGADLSISSADFAFAVGMKFDDQKDDSEPVGDGHEMVPGSSAERTAIVRLSVLLNLLPALWSSSSTDPQRPWRWKLTINRRGLRPYRHVNSAEDLLEREQRSTVRQFASGVSYVSQVNVITSPSGRSSEPEVSAVETTVPKSSSELDISLLFLRPEIIEVSTDLVRSRRFDDAIFAAFRRLEHEVQQRTGSRLIGDSLLKTAFTNSASRIRVSDREGDQGRLLEIFAGAIGLFKGDRSHKDRPALPCRSRDECIRLLAHASTLLDLLDRDIDKAPIIKGYEHRQGDTLTLWVERAGPQVTVWLNESVQLEKLRYAPGTIVVDVSSVSRSEHRVHLIDGNRQGPAHAIWLTNEAGRSSWYRVDEINIPLYNSIAGDEQYEVTGVRLRCLEDGVVTDRVYPTRETYVIGHYVSWNWSRTEGVGGAWVRDPASGTLRKIWEVSTLFEGQPVAPAHEPRLTHVSMEPNRLLLRRGVKTPLRAFAHYTDGVAKWSTVIDDPKVTIEGESAFFRGQVAIAKSYGTCIARCVYEGCSAEASIEVAAHPRGTATMILRGLPPVAGIASTPTGVIVSVRGNELWKVGEDGKFEVATAIPQGIGMRSSTDTLAARSDGELAIKILGEREIFVAHQIAEYSTTHIVSVPGTAVPMAMTWIGSALAIGMSDQTVVISDGDSIRPFTTLDGTPISMCASGDHLYILCAHKSNSSHRQGQNSLYRFSIQDSTQSEDLLAKLELFGLSGLALEPARAILSDFGGGRVLALNLEDGQLVQLVGDLQNPSQLTIDNDGNIYIAEFGAGAVWKILS